MGDRAQREAWVTLATNDAYALGCLVLGNSLRRVNTTRRLVVMVSNGISEGMRNQLQGVFDSLVDVDVLDSEDARNLSLLGRPDLNVTYTKIHCWELVEYDKCVFLDADTLVLQNCDELFDREEFSAAPDAGWPDCFNSGVFVFCPSLETYQALLSFAGTKGSFDGGDQGLLNSYFNTWATADIAKHLPFIYNVVSQAFYSYLPAFTQFRNSIKIVHFIGPIKPWNHAYNTATRTVTVFPETGHCQEFLQMWWDIFMGEVQPRLDPTVTPFIRYEYVLPSSPPPPPLPPQQGAEAAPPQEEQPSSYQVLYPYVPPALEQAFYTPPQPSQEPSPPQHHPPPSACPHEEAHGSPPGVCVEASEEEMVAPSGEGDVPEAPQVIDMPIVVRSFHTFETHYVEESLLLIDPDAPPPAHYDSYHFEQSLAVETEKLKSEEPAGELVISVVQEDSVEGSGHVEVSHIGADDERDGTKEVEAEGAKEDSGDRVAQGGDVHSKDVNSNRVKEEGSVGGLVGELAQLKVGDGGDGADFMVLDDRERRLAWERGHADYMGMDKFENIQRKLDEKMAPTPSKESLKKPEGGLSESSITKPAEVNEMDALSGVVSFDSVPPPSVVAVSSVSVPSEPTPPEVQPDLPSPAAGGEGEVAACYAQPPVAVPISLAQPVPVAEEVSEPSSVETVELTSSLEAPVAVPATVPVVPHEAEPVVSASVSLGGGAGGEAEEVTETVTLGSSSATFVTAPAPAAEASISLSGPAAPVPEPSPQEPASTSFTMPLAPQAPAPVAEPLPPAVTSVSLPSEAPPVPEKKVPTPLGKPQEKLTPLQIGKKPPPPTPEKPASPAGVAGPKSPPPPVAQKPTSPVSPGGSKAPPLAPAKPASPAATSIAAQRSMFEKPAPDPSKPAPRVGGSVSAFAARFQQPPAQTPMSRPTPGMAPKPTSPTSAGIIPKPTSPTSPGVAPKPTSPTSPGVGPKPTSPSGASAAPPSAPSPSSAGQGSKNAEFLARFGLKKK